MASGARGLVAAVTHDGGATWQATYPPFTECVGGTAENGGDFQRASDLGHVRAERRGALRQPLALVHRLHVGGGTAILVSRSTDGGTRGAIRSRSYGSGWSTRTRARRSAPTAACRTSPFDIEKAPFAEGYFLGAYEGLASVGSTFLSFFSATAADPDNTYLARISPAP